MIEGINGDCENLSEPIMMNIFRVREIECRWVEGMRNIDHSPSWLQSVNMPSDYRIGNDDIEDNCVSGCSSVNMPFVSSNTIDNDRPLQLARKTLVTSSDTSRIHGSSSPPSELGFESRFHSLASNCVDPEILRLVDPEAEFHSLEGDCVDPEILRPSQIAEGDSAYYLHPFWCVPRVN